MTYLTFNKYLSLFFIISNIIFQNIFLLLENWLRNGKLKDGDISSLLIFLVIEIIAWSSEIKMFETLPI